MATASSDSSSGDDEIWARYFDAKADVALGNGDVFRTYRAGNTGPHIVLLHGGGYTSMTWCLVTGLLKELYTIHAIDFRGHGSTVTSDDADLSIEALVRDVGAVLDQILPHDASQTIIAGHSLGGAVAVRVAATERVVSLVGVMVIDVVEGTALASLEHMDRILAKRPRAFASHHDAIQWAISSGTVRNPEAAAVSIPSQLATSAPNGMLAWRTDLKRSAPYWRGWFQGLSEQFLSLKAAKILVLAGSDRLDTALMRDQMMGKFELRLLYGSGHAIQEDCPEQTAQAIIDFASRCTRIAPTTGLSFGAAIKPSANSDALAERLARARAMMPKPPSA